MILVTAKVFGFASYGWLVAFSPMFVAIGIFAAMFVALWLEPDLRPKVKYKGNYNGKS